MTVCVVGSGGREHALALALSRTTPVVVAPGSPAMAAPEGAFPGGYPIGVSPQDPGRIHADLVVIGPEQPLVEGVADRLRADGRQVFGPGADGAVLEGSKATMKQLLEEARVPTARYGAFDDARAAIEFLRSLPGPYVVKTDGLAAGKGVLVTADRGEAEADIRAKLSGSAFGDAGRKVVVEEALSGAECSLLVVTDGRRLVPLAPAQDFKRLEDGDQGPNTGGMGAFSPVPAADDRLVDRVLDEAVEPTLAALRRRGIDYRGVLYAGLMLTDEGPKILEYNVRFGDPETQVVLPRLREDLAGLLAEAAAGRLRSEARFGTDAAVCVVLAAEGYPGPVRSGDAIEGLDVVQSVPGVTAVHAGTGLGEDGRLVTAGGRVLGITALGDTVASARQLAYRGVALVSWPGMRYRRDIAAGAPDTAAGSAGAQPLPGTAGAGAPDTAAGAPGAQPLPGGRR